MSEGVTRSAAELERLRLEGLDHLVCLQSGAVTDQEERAFRTWLERDAAHAAAFDAALRLQQLARIAGARHFAGAAAEPSARVLPFARSPRPGVDRRTLLVGAIAASVAGGVALGRSLDLVPDPSVLRADYRTLAGERRRVTLAGGATVTLNTRTSIALRRDLGRAAIELISGEALVTQGRGRARALLVAEGGSSVTGAGSFNARRDGAEVCISCLSGGVEVAWRGTRRVLRALDSVRYDASGIGAVTGGVDPAALTAWQTGTLIFRAMPMRSVIAELNRYRSGRILLVNAHLARVPLTGTYHVDRLDDFFSQVQVGLGVTVTHLPGNVVILT